MSLISNAPECSTNEPYLRNDDLEAIISDWNYELDVRLLAGIHLELRQLNNRLEQCEKDIRSVKFNQSHPLLKLLFR